MQWFKRLVSRPNPEPTPTSAAEFDLYPTDAASFLTALECALIQELDVHQTDNIYHRYPPDGVLMDPKAYTKKRADYLHFVSQHYKELFKTLTLLEDKESRRLFVGLILYRMLGYQHVKLPTNTPEFWNAVEAVNLVPSVPSQFNDRPEGKELRRFSVNTDGHPFEIDCWIMNVFFTFFVRQYYLNRPHVKIGPQPGDHVIDAGACFGDTALDFAHKVGPNGRIHSFEILGPHLEILNHNLKQNPRLKNITVHPMALGEVARQGTIGAGDINPGFTPTEDLGEQMGRLDDLIEDKTIERVDFIKMDIEGNELATLRGGENAIRRFRPRLAISLYHRPEDYYTIPHYIESLGLGYMMYLENYTISDGETILYCA